MRPRLPRTQRPRTLAGALFLGSLLACSQQERNVSDATRDSANAGVERVDSMAARSAGELTLADPATGAQLDSVATAARGGLLSVSPAVAVPLIRTFEQKLDNSDDAQLDEIADELEKLREELDGTKLEPQEIASVLERLGPKVRAVAPKAGGAQGTVSAIGDAIVTAAQQLRGSNR